MEDAIGYLIALIISYPFILFIGLGYFTGYLFRDIHIIKIIIILVFVPTMIDLMIRINALVIATIPFVVSGLVGFIGLEKTKYKLIDGVDFIRDMIGRIR